MNLDGQVHVLDQRSAFPIELIDDRRAVGGGAAGSDGNHPQKVLTLPEHEERERDSRTF